MRVMPFFSDKNEARVLFPALSGVVGVQKQKKKEEEIRVCKHFMHACVDSIRRFVYGDCFFVFRVLIPCEFLFFHSGFAAAVRLGDLILHLERGGTRVPEGI